MNLLKVLCILLVLSVASCKKTKEESGKIQMVSPTEMQALVGLDDLQLVDVRTPEEVSEGAIPNAQNIDYYSPTFDADIEKLDKDKPVVLYCRSGKRSAKCAQKLLDAGFKKIYDLEGGFSRWTDEGLESNTNL